MIAPTARAIRAVTRPSGELSTVSASRFAGTTKASRRLAGESEARAGPTTGMSEAEAQPQSPRIPETMATMATVPMTAARVPLDFSDHWRPIMTQKAMKGTRTMAARSAASGRTTGTVMARPETVEAGILARVSWPRPPVSA